MGTNKFLKTHIIFTIEEGHKSIGYLLGYIDACKFLRAITEETYLDVRKCLRENEEKILNQKGFIDIK